MYVDVREADELEEMIERAANISLGQLIRRHGNPFR